jgi:hypothetical protein
MDDPYHGLVAHPPITEDGWYFCFVNGSDLVAVAEKIEHFMDLGYVMHGEPFVFDGKVCQAMYLPAGPGLRRHKRLAAERVPVEYEPPKSLWKRIVTSWQEFWDRF